MKKQVKTLSEAGQQLYNSLEQYRTAKVNLGKTFETIIDWNMAQDGLKKSMVENENWN